MCSLMGPPYTGTKPIIGKGYCLHPLVDCCVRQDQGDTSGPPPPHVNGGLQPARHVPSCGALVKSRMALTLVVKSSPLTGAKGEKQHTWHRQFAASPWKPAKQHSLA